MGYIADTWEDMTLPLNISVDTWKSWTLEVFDFKKETQI